MTKAEQKKLLEDKWPKASEKDRLNLIKAVKEAAKLGLFEIKSQKKEFIAG